MSKIAKKENPIYDKTESCIRLIFSSAALLAIQLPGEPPRTSEGGQLIYQIDLETIGEYVNPFGDPDYDYDDDRLQELLTKIKALCLVLGEPLVIETDYPGFKSIDTSAFPLVSWVKAVWLAYILTRQHGKQGYANFLQVLGAIKS